MSEVKKNGTATKSTARNSTAENRTAPALSKSGATAEQQQGRQSVALVSGRSEGARTKLLLIDYNDGEATHQHPALGRWTRDGWRVKSASPRLTEMEGTKLFVVLVKDGAHVCSSRNSPAAPSILWPARPER